MSYITDPGGLYSPTGRRQRKGQYGWLLVVIQAALILLKIWVPASLSWPAVLIPLWLVLLILTISFLLWVKTHPVLIQRRVVKKLKKKTQQERTWTDRRNRKHRSIEHRGSDY